MGAMEDLQVPRVRTGDFHPCFLEPHERHLFKLEELIYAMYAGGLSTRDIFRTLEPSSWIESTVLKGSP